MGGGKGGGDASEEAVAAQLEANRQAIAEQRRQFDATQANLKPFIDAGTEQLPVLSERATVGGLDAILGDIFGSGSFENLRDERIRAIQGQLASGGLTRSGVALQEIADVPTGLGLQIENLLTNRSASLAGQGQTGVRDLGSFGANAANAISNIHQSSGQAQASGILAGQQAKAAGQDQGFQNIISGASAGAAIGGPWGAAAGGLAGAFFSDPALKENVEHIGQAGDLNLYQWDWISGSENTVISKCGNTGFMADEVKEKYPQHVYDFAGFMMIDYPSLLDEMEAKHADVS